MKTHTEQCEVCPVNKNAKLIRMGIDIGSAAYGVALAGNPNVGKSTVFNGLTGLKQHTGNWPGKTVLRAEGAYSFGGKRFKVVDLPGTYSLLSTSSDEEVARDFILSGEPDVTVIVADATRLERNLNLVLQVLEITNRAVVCVNLMDEARRHGITLDLAALERELGVPVVGASVRHGEGIRELVAAMERVAGGTVTPAPFRVPGLPAPQLRWQQDGRSQDKVSETIFEHAQRIAHAAQPLPPPRRPPLAPPPA